MWPFRGRRDATWREPKRDEEKGLLDAQFDAERPGYGEVESSNGKTTCFRSRRWQVVASLALLSGYAAFQSGLVTLSSSGEGVFGFDDSFGLAPLDWCSWLGMCKKHNVIFMVSDGYGPASATLGRSYLQYVDSIKPKNAADAAHIRSSTTLDDILVGTHRSRSANSLVTDSAAGATAFACGIKTNNYAIGVDSDAEPCGTVLEGAKEKGYLTGVVVTTRITDATPASFFAHVSNRGQESGIANEVLGFDDANMRYRAPPLDLTIGGGGCFFLPQSDPFSCRQDDMDLVDLAREQKWNIEVLFKNESMRANSSALSRDAVDLPYLSLLTPSDTPLVIDRPSSIPSLPTIAERALNSLQRSKKNKKGFFVVIEGSQIDICGHANDPACQVREVAEYQETVKRVLEWAESAHKKRGERTLIVSTSDHETGGLDLGRQQAKLPVYNYFPKSLYGVQHSTRYLGQKLVDFAGKGSVAPDQAALQAFIRNDVLGASGLAFTPEHGGEPSEIEVARVLACLSADPDSSPFGLAQVCQEAIADCVSRRANIGWSTHGHTGVDVNVYASGPGSDVFRGNHENIDLGNLVAKHLKVDLKAVTRRLLKQRRGNESNR